MRHGISRHKNGDQYGVRYKCLDCGKTVTVIATDGKYVSLNYGPGRPTRKDWRFEA